MNDPPPAKVVAVAAGIGYEPAVLAAAVVVKLIHITSAVFVLTIVKPCNVVCAVKALTAVPPVVTVPEQSVAVTFVGSCVVPIELVPAGTELTTLLLSAFSNAIVEAAADVVGKVAGESTVVPVATDSWLFGLSLVTRERSVATDAVDAGLTATPSTFCPAAPVAVPPITTGGLALAEPTAVGP